MDGKNGKMRNMKLYELYIKIRDNDRREIIGALYAISNPVLQGSF